MWLTSESEDEYVVRGVPVFFWLVTAAFAGGGAYILPRVIKDPEVSFESIVFIAGIFFLPALAILAFAPLIVSRFNRREGVATYSKYGLLGISSSRFRYAELKGGVRISAEEDEEGGLVYSAYFELKNGKRLKMCSEPGQWQGRNYDVGMKANEFLRQERSPRSTMN